MSKNNIQPSLINDISPNNVKLPQRPCWDGWITPGWLQSSYSDKLQCVMMGCFALKAFAHGILTALSRTPSNVCVQRQGETARLMGVWDNIQLLDCWNQIWAQQVCCCNRNVIQNASLAVGRRGMSSSNLVRRSLVIQWSCMFAWSLFLLQEDIFLACGMSLHGYQTGYWAINVTPVCLCRVQNIC